MKVIAINVCFYLVCMNALAEPVAYKVERIVYSRSGSWSGKLTGLEQPLAQIGLSASQQGEKIIPVPAREDFEHIILVGTENIASRTSLYEFEKRCEFLCGDDAEECHHTALIHYNNQDIGTPLLALVGITGEISGFRKYEATETSEINELNIEKQPLSWPADNYLSLDMKNNEVTFTASYEGRGAYSYDASAPDCKTIKYLDSGFERLSCNGVEFLMHDQNPLLMSYADYNVSSVQVLNEFRIDNQVYYTVLLAMKAYTAYGVLTRTESGWRFIVRPADWASIC